MQTHIYRKKNFSGSVNSEGHLKKFKNQHNSYSGLDLSIYQKPNPARETVPLKSVNNCTLMRCSVLWPRLCMIYPWHISTVLFGWPVLPTGRLFCCISQKGPNKKYEWPGNCAAEFWLMLTEKWPMFNKIIPLLLSYLILEKSPRNIVIFALTRTKTIFS